MEFTEYQLKQNYSDLNVSNHNYHGWNVKIVNGVVAVLPTKKECEEWIIEYKKDINRTEKK